MPRPLPAVRTSASRRSWVTCPAVLVLVGLLATLSACGGTPPSATGPNPGPTATQGTGTTSGPGPSGTAGSTVARSTTTVALPRSAPLTERLTAAGLAVAGPDDDLYAIPQPLPKGEPGDIIRVQPVKGSTISDADVVRVLYHSRDRAGTDVAVTGIIAIPTAGTPADGWPVVSWTHGTTGIGPNCAPSKRNDRDQLAQGFITSGHVWTATDYYGLGPQGLRHPYLSGASEAHSAIDIVRAARLLGLDAISNRWVVYGHSQGGHAALFTGQLAPTYAPELDLLGTVASAPGSGISALGLMAATPARTFLYLALLGLPTDYPELKPDDYLTPKAMAASRVVDTGCAQQAGAAIGDLSGPQLITANPSEVEPAKSILAENDPGQLRTSVPIFIPHGSADTTVSPTSSDALEKRMCTFGQVVERKVYDGVDHGTLVAASATDVDRWIDDRFAGLPARTDCEA